MAGSSFDSPTLSPGGLTTAHGDERLARVPTLTILWHPEIDRVGDSFALTSKRCEVSRRAPVFGERKGGASGAPLGDPYISAREHSFALRESGARVDIEPGRANANVKVNGAVLGDTVSFSRADLDRGVVITLARRVVLCLHLARPARTPARHDHGLVGASDAIDDIRREIEQVAGLDVPVLIRGESGTGKGAVAAAIVAASARAKQPYVSLNMGATVPSTAASDLFGHERGSFTGANATKIGLFGAADGGSLFLDEIGVTPLDVQPMLLHVLESGEIRPLGSTRTRKVDVRFIAATDADLERAIAAGRFSDALLQRLARYPITVPPLRDRREDFGALLVHFIRLAFEKYGEPDRLASGEEGWLSASTVAALARHRWPGNIREIENVAGQIVLFSRGQTTAAIPPSVRALLAQDPGRASAPVASRTPDGKISAEQVSEALARGKGSASRAAAILGVSRTTYYELRKRNSSIRSISEIGDAELAACRDECGGDVARMAQRLGVPLKALKDRLGRLPRSSS